MFNASHPASIQTAIPVYVSTVASHIAPYALGDAAGRMVLLVLVRGAGGVALALRCCIKRMTMSLVPHIALTVPDHPAQESWSPPQFAVGCTGTPCWCDRQRMRR